MIYTLTLHAALDRVLKVPGFPDEDVMRSELLALLAAGKGFNLSRNLAILGQESTAAGLVGNADAGFYQRSFGKLGIATLLESCAAPTRMNITIVNPDSGREVHLREKGAAVSLESFERLRLKLRERLTPGDVLAICGSLPEGIEAMQLGAVMRDARESDVWTLLDSSGEGLRFPAESPPRLLKVNGQELAEFTGQAVSSVESAADAAKGALGRGIELVLVTLGARGALGVSCDEVLHASTEPVKATNTVGAGDAFNAGFLWKRPAGLETALRFAVACGAAQAGGAHIGTLAPAAVEQLAASATLRAL
jgi:1-phosphofructokinase